MIGHSTVLIEAAGEAILTDPYFGGNGKHFVRTAVPAKKRESFKDVGTVLISHGHQDHMDEAFLRSLPENTTVIMPMKLVALAETWGGSPFSIQPWKTVTISGLSITGVPAVHPGGGLGYIVSVEGKRIYFAGDTAYGEFMTEIGNKFKIDVALMPVTSFRVKVTMGEQDALKAAAALKPKVIIPIHLDIQPTMSILRSKETPEHFRQLVMQAHLETEVRILRNGESWQG